MPHDSPTVVREPPKVSHLLAGLTACGLVGAVLLSGLLYAHRVERRAIHSLTDPTAAMVVQHGVVQIEALRHRELLPAYGSSELLYTDPFHGCGLFRTRPTGFTPFPVAQHGAKLILQLQKLAVLGPQLHGRKVIVSFTPGNFLQQADRDASYAGNFSPLAANELAFSTELSFSVKQAAAQRMLKFPETLAEEPLLRFALEKLADGSPTNRALYYAALPLGKMQNAVLRAQDHWDAVMTLRHHPPSPAPSPVSLAPGAPIDWAALLKRADRDYRSHADNNPFGFDNQAWTTMHARWVLKKKNTMSDEEFRQRVAQTPEWSDLDLLLDGLKDLGAEPLLLSTPLNGGYYDFTGVTHEGRRAYYEKLRAVAAAHGVPVVDFAEHDDDKYFLIDPGHLSSKGWIYFAQAFDAFYHDRLTGSPALVQGALH